MTERRAAFRARRAERGAIAIVVALMMVALCIAAAMVLDLGLVRVDRQQNKSAADAAAMAGVNGLVPDVNSDDFHPFGGVCQALHYLQANIPELSSFATSTWSDGTGVPTLVDGCDPSLAASTCNKSAVAPGTWARFVGTTADGRFRVKIQSGYDVADTSDGPFPVESLAALSADPGSPVYHGCDQLAVIVTELRDTTLGRLVTGGLSSTIRSVGRVDVAPPESPFALLVLERTACDALAVASGGAGGRIDVLGFQDHPGMIHVDSAGGGAMCASKPIVEGKNPGTCPDPAPPAAATCGGIVAHESDTAFGPLYPGRITVSAISNVSDGTPQTYAGPYPGTSPTYRDQITRKIVDDIYLKGVHDAVVGEAGPAFAAAAAGSPAALAGPWVSTGCSPSAADQAAVKVFVSCGNFNNDATFANATDLIFTGKVASANLLMPKARHVYIVGGTTPAGVSVGPQFRMNTNGAATCPTYNPSGGRARLFIKKGALSTAGGSTFQACNTTVVLMGGDAGACLPSLSPYITTYTNTPCPGPTPAGNGPLSMGGNGTVDWTAPDTVDDLVKATAADHYDLEDLALWDETYGTQTLGGGGTMHLSGVFSAPNAAPFKLNGGPVQDVKNSQYVVRQLWSTGNGTLTMQPLPSLPVAPPTITFGLVR